MAKYAGFNASRGGAVQYAKTARQPAKTARRYFRPESAGSIVPDPCAHAERTGHSPGRVRVAPRGGSWPHSPHSNKQYQPKTAMSNRRKGADVNAVRDRNASLRKKECVQGPLRSDDLVRSGARVAPSARAPLWQPPVSGVPRAKASGHANCETAFIPGDLSTIVWAPRSPARTHQQSRKARRALR